MGMSTGDGARRGSGDATGVSTGSKMNASHKLDKRNKNTEMELTSIKRSSPQYAKFLFQNTTLEAECDQNSALVSF